MGRSMLFLHQLFRLLRLLAALLGVENPLADAIRLRRDFKQFVVSQIFNRLVEGHLPGRSEADFHVPARGTNIRQVFLLANVDRHILPARILAYDHSFIHCNTRTIEQHAALLRVLQSISGCIAHLPSHERASRARGHRSRHFIVTVKDCVHDPRAARGGEELIAETEQAACGSDIDHACHSLTRVLHIGHQAAPAPQHFHHHADSLVARFDMHFIIRFEQFAIVRFVKDDLRTRDLKFLAFAPHRFDENAEMQLATARD